MTALNKKLDLLTELAKLSPSALAAVKVMAEHLRDVEKMSPQEFSTLLIKMERARIQVLAKSEPDRLRKSAGKKTWGEHYGLPLGSPLNPVR